MEIKKIIEQSKADRKKFIRKEKQVIIGKRRKLEAMKEHNDDNMLLSREQINSLFQYCIIKAKLSKYAM